MVVVVTGNCSDTWRGVMVFILGIVRLDDCDGGKGTFRRTYDKPACFYANNILLWLDFDGWEECLMNQYIIVSFMKKHISCTYYRGTVISGVMAKHILQFANVRDCAS